MNQRNQEEFVKCFSDNWYKIFEVMNGNGDADPVDPEILMQHNNCNTKSKP